MDMRWKPAPDAFAVTFADRWPAAAPTNQQGTVDLTVFLA
jgi:hypothetical protein